MEEEIWVVFFFSLFHCGRISLPIIAGIYAKFSKGFPDYEYSHFRGRRDNVAEVVSLFFQSFAHTVIEWIFGRVI